MESYLLAQVYFAASDVATASLSVEGLPAVAAKPLGKGCPCVVDVVSGAFSIGAPAKYHK